MQLKKSFDVDCSRDLAATVLADDATITDLFSDQDTEITHREGNRRTAVSRYRALGREGEATFHFTFLDDGNIAFAKVCDGNVWKKLDGRVELRESSGGCRVTIDMDGRTKAFVPEITIRGPMKDQIDQMARALRDRIQTAARS